jgi:predicted aldo/keto reductase-like oxidoreductase
MAGIAGTAVFPFWANGFSMISHGNRKNKIIFRILGKTGVKLPIISIGALSFDASLYQTALDRGISHIDTSQYYFNGKHEILVGDVLKGRPRDSFVVSTKIMIGNGQSGQHSTLALADAPTLADRFNISLERLGLEHVDIFYVAGINSRNISLNDDLMKGLQKIKKSGKARFVGVATHQNEPEVLRAAVESCIYDVVLVAYNFRQIHGDEVKKAIGEATKAGLGVIAMKPMAGAYWDKERTLPINAKAALKWALQDKNVHSVVTGIMSLDELETDLSIMDKLEMTSKEKDSLKCGEKNSFAGLYCQQCGKCRTQCLSSLDIPTLMRSYMYMYGYGDAARARASLDQFDLSYVGCHECVSCTVTCSLRMDVRARILDIIRLKSVPEDFLNQCPKSRMP